MQKFNLSFTGLSVPDNVVDLQADDFHDESASLQSAWLRGRELVNIQQRKQIHFRFHFSGCTESRTDLRVF